MDEKLRDFVALLHRRQLSAASPRVPAPPTFAMALDTLRRSRRGGSPSWRWISIAVAALVAAAGTGGVLALNAPSDTRPALQTPAGVIVPIAAAAPTSEATHSVVSSSLRAPSDALAASEPTGADAASGTVTALPAQTALVMPPATSRAPSAKPEVPQSPLWLRNAAASPPKDGRPRIVLVIDDLGLDRKRSDRTVALPGPLTLSFLPYANDLPRQTAAARRAGHELLVHIPMEPLGHVADTGPNQLDVGLSHDEVLERLRWDLARFDGYVGINNHMGSKFTGDADALRPVIEELRERGLLFLDSRTGPGSLGVELAQEIGVPHAGRDVFLDDEVTVPAIEAQLGELERLARRNGSAIAIGHPHDQTLEVLERWLRSLSQKGLVLVPLSAIVRERAVSG